MHFKFSGPMQGLRAHPLPPVCVFKAPRTYTPVLGALVSPLGTYRITPPTLLLRHEIHTFAFPFAFP